MRKDVGVVGRHRIFLLFIIAEVQRQLIRITSLDDLIAAQTQKLEALKTHKKGLMQRLFPSPESG